MNRVLTVAAAICFAFSLAIQAQTPTAATQQNQSNPQEISAQRRALAKALAAQGTRVSVIADSAAASVLNQVDLVLVGADKITPEYLVNKIGTRMIALAARERAVTVCAACDTSKLIDADYHIASARDRRSVDELWPEAPKEVVVVNRYFEPTPLALFTTIITEQGELSPEETARRAERASIDSELADALARCRSRC